MKRGWIAFAALLCLLTWTGAMAQETALFEDFEAGVWPPAGWTADADWYMDNMGDPGGCHGSPYWSAPAPPIGGNWAVINSDCVGGGLYGSLTTGPINLGLANTATLEFDHRFDTFYYYATGYVNIRSSSSGGMWQNLGVYFLPFTTNHASFDISAHAGATDVEIEFYYDDWGWYEMFWDVDNIEVTYDPCFGFWNEWWTAEACNEIPQPNSKAPYDGVIDPGETVLFSDGFFNFCYVDMDNVVAFATTDHPCITLLEDYYYIGHLPGGQFNKNPKDAAQFQFLFQVAPEGCCNFQCGDEFTLTVTVQGDISQPNGDKQDFVTTHDYTLVFGGANVVVDELSNEDFYYNPAAPPLELPADWISEQVYWDNTGTAPLWVSNMGTRYPSGYPAHSVPGLAYFNSFSCSANDQARLYHNTQFDLTGYTAAELSFWMFRDNGWASNNDRLQAQVSTDGGGSWINVGPAISRYDASGDFWPANAETVDLSAYVNQTIMVGFLATSGYGNDVHIDDVLLTGTIEGACVWDPCDAETDLGITKDVDAGGAVAGEPVTFTITVENLDTGVGRNVIVSDVLPAGLDYVSCTTTVGICSYNEITGIFEVVIGDMCPGDPPVVITLTVIPTTGGDFVNEACVAEGVLEDTNPANDCDTAEFSVAAFTHTFVDDYGRSWCCVNEITGQWEWTALDPRLGLFVLPGDGFVTWKSGFMLVQSLPGTPWSMALKYNHVQKRASGYFQYLPYRIKSALSDLNTLNNPPICDVPSVPMR